MLIQGGVSGTLAPAAERSRIAAVVDPQIVAATMVTPPILLSPAISRPTFPNPQDRYKLQSNPSKCRYV
jgi:hypothetical protein